MRSVDLVSWLPPFEVPDSFAQSLPGYITIAGIGVLLGLIILPSLSAIVGEYAKRIWFDNLAWHDALRRARRALKRLEKAIDRLTSENKWLSDKLEEVLRENEHLQQRIIVLETQKSALSGARIDPETPPESGDASQAGHGDS